MLGVYKSISAKVSSLGVILPTTMMNLLSSGSVCRNVFGSCVPCGIEAVGTVFPML